MDTEVHFTNHLCFIARGRGLIRVGDTARAAKEALEIAIIECQASSAAIMRNRITDEPIQPIIGHLPISTVGWVQMDKDIDSELYK